MSISQQEFKRRYTAIRELMKREELDCLLVVGLSRAAALLGDAGGRSAAEHRSDTVAHCGRGVDARSLGAVRRGYAAGAELVAGEGAPAERADRAGD